MEYERKADIKATAPAFTLFSAALDVPDLVPSSVRFPMQCGESSLGPEYDASVTRFYQSMHIHNTLRLGATGKGASMQCQLSHRG